MYNLFQKVSIIVSLFSLGTALYGQSPSWDNNYGIYGSTQFATSICNSNPFDLVPGYVAGGHEYDTYRGLTMKVDLNGNLMWTKYYSKDLRLVSLQWTSDGGYITSGSYMVSGVMKPYVMKMTVSGDCDWDVELGQLDGEFASYIVETNACDGYVFVTSAGHILKMNLEHSIAWDYAYGYPGNPVNCYTWCNKTSDGGYIISGYTQSPGGQNTDILVVRVTVNGTLVWVDKYDNFGSYEWASSIQQTIDGGYVIAGGYGDIYNETNILLIKIRGDHSQEWAKSFGYPSSIDIAQAVRQTPEGGYVMACDVSPLTQDIMIIKTNGSGDMIWSKVYGGSGWDGSMAPSLCYG